MLFKSIKAELEADREKRLIKGYASTFESPDRHDSHGDIISKTAFDQTLAEQFSVGFIKMLWMHYEPLGMPVEMRVDSRGLYVEGRVSKTQLGDEALTLVEDKVVDGLSIGFDPLEYTMLEEKTANGDQIRRIDKLKLYEWSPVIWGSNPYAKITGVAKSLQGLGAKALPVAEMLLAELKAGRVLSQYNFDSLLKARDIIDHVLKSAQPEEDQKQVEAICELRSAVSKFTEALAAKY